MDGAIWIVVEVAEIAGELEGRVFCRVVLSGFGVSAKSVKGFDGEDLLREDMAELAGCLMSDVFE